MFLKYDLKLTQLIIGCENVSMLFVQYEAVIIKSLIAKEIMQHFCMNRLFLFTNIINLNYWWYPADEYTPLRCNKNRRHISTYRNGQQQRKHDEKNETFFIR